jgi:hypothetical protein
MTDEVRQIQKASWLFLGLALFMLANFLFGAPSIGFLSSRFMMWTALVAGLVAGVGAMQCVIYLKRRNLALPGVTVAAVIVGGLTFVGSALIVGYGISSIAN